MDELEGCDVCGGDHATEACPELGLAESRENPLCTKARLTLPEGLEVVTDEDGRNSIITSQPISAKTQFGPFEARKTTFNIDSDNIFVLKVFTKDGGTVCYDTTDENFCNWLCLVRTAESCDDQNLIAYTLGMNVFYNTTKDVAVGEELRVWYAPAYARKLGKSPTPDGVTSTMLGEMLIFQEDDTLSQIGSPTADSSRTQHENLLENHINIKYEALFQCTQCGTSFQSQSDYVRHLREHLMPSRDKPSSKTSSYKCKTCHIGFNTYSNYNRHMKKHDGNRIECPICKHNTYRADLFTTHYVGKHKQSYDDAKRILSEHSFEKVKESVDDATGVEDGTENQIIVHRKRGRPRKKPKIEVTTDEDEVAEVVQDEVEEERCKKRKVELKKIESEIVEEKHVVEQKRVVEPKRVVEQKSEDEEIYEIVQKQVLLTNQTSPIRVQPRRSLKGRRITGVLAESDEESTHHEESCVEKTPAVVSPVKKPGRGRPRKNMTVEKKDDPKLTEKRESKIVLSESSKTVTDIQTDVQTEENKEVSDSALENEIVHVLIELGEGHSKNVGNAELVTERNDTSTTIIKIENPEPSLEDIEQEEQMEESCSELDDEAQSDEDFIPSAAALNKPPVHRKPGRPPGSFRKRPIDKEILELEKLTKVETTSKGKNYACGVCWKKFAQPSYLRLHLPRHTSKFKCKYCGRSFARKESYQKHDCRSKNIQIVSRENDDGEKVFACGECNEDFDTWDAARKHTLDHSGLFTCHTCMKVFSRRHLLLDHICRTDDGKNRELFQCEICQQEFRTLRYLYRHMAMHTDIFKCDSCSKTFSRKDSLQRHILKCNPELASEQNIFPCNICKKVFSTKLGLENHEINCAKYVCEICRLAFFTEENMDQHRCMGKVLYDDATIHYACTECGKSFASINYLHRHEASHSHTYSCDICQKIFTQQNQHNYHYKLCWAKKKIKEDTFAECDICNEHFENPKVYREHYHSHTHPHKCEACEKRFIKIGTLAMHVCSTSKEEEPTLACMSCDKMFKSQRALEKHQIKHTEPTEQCEYCEKKFHRLQDHICHMPDGTVVRMVYKKNRLLIKENLVCHECGRSFVSISNLNKHILIHGERHNECDICGKKFHYANYLREHRKMVHMKVYRLQCSYCGKVLFSKTGLLAHIRQFHDSEIKLYRCPQCPKTFRQKGNLKTHMFSHTKVKGFTCEFCGKMFKYPDQYNKHKLEHTMMNKIECTMCDKKFCREYQHRKHVELHHSGIVYICDVCHERCSHRHTIIRHYKRKHPDVAHVFDENPDYIETLQKPVNSIDEPQQMAVKLETVLATDENGIERAYTIQTHRDDGYLPQEAAEALQNLSTAVIQTTMEDGNTINTIEGPDGEQTVVILQIVNSDGTSIQEASIEEVQTMIEESEVLAE